MDLIIGAEIIINNPTPEICKFIEERYILENPEYAKLQRMGKWLGNTPKMIYLYRKDSDCIILPYGTLEAIWKEIKARYGIVNYQFRFATNPAWEGGQAVSLYDYQQKAVEAVKLKHCGIIQSPAGSGKTQMGIALACNLKKKTLWITHTKDLLNQSYERAAQYIEQSQLGKIAGGKIEIGSAMTFATIQTLAKADLEALKYSFDMIIVDECHRVCGSPAAVSMFSKVLNALAAERKYGLSATVHRADGMIRATQAFIGPVIYTVPAQAVKDKIMQVMIKRIDTEIEMPEAALSWDGMIDYTKLINCLSDNGKRNLCITDVLMSCHEHYNLILSDRISHLEFLCSDFPKETVAFISGKTKASEREQLLKEVREGKRHYLFATYTLAKEGLDIPRLDRLHLVTPQKDFAIVVQAVGRVARAFPGKIEAICYDYVDDFGLAQRYWKKRCTSYKRCGCIILK